MCNYTDQLNAVHRSAVNTATEAGTQTAYCSDHPFRFELDSPACAPETGFKCPAISQMKFFCKIYWQHCVAATLRAHCATVCTPRNIWETNQHILTSEKLLNFETEEFCQLVFCVVSERRIPSHSSCSWQMVPIVLAADGGLPMSHNYSRFYYLFLCTRLAYMERVCWITRATGETKTVKCNSFTIAVKVNFNYVSKDFHMSVLKDKDILKVKIWKNIFLNADNEPEKVGWKLWFPVPHQMQQCISLSCVCQFYLNFVD